ncbi:unnamed protein product [Mortierella alpina]
MQRRNRNTALDAAEDRIEVMENRAAEGFGIRKVDYKFVQDTLKKSTPVTLDFKLELFYVLRARGATVVLDQGEADIAIRHRAEQLLGEGIEFVVVGNDCDYAIHPTITTLLRPWGRDKFLEYDIPTCLKEASLSRAQYQALGAVSHTDYSWNLPRLGIGNNSRIIRSISSEHDDVVLILSRYDEHPEDKAAWIKYEEQEMASRSAKPINFEASRRIFVQGQETYLTPLQKEAKRFTKCHLEQRIRELKSRMLEASRIRRLVIKEKKERRQLFQENPSLQQQGQEQRRRHRRNYNRFRTVDGPSERIAPPPPLYAQPLTQPAPPAPLAPSLPPVHQPSSLTSQHPGQGLPLLPPHLRPTQPGPHCSAAPVTPQTHEAAQRQQKHSQEICTRRRDRHPTVSARAAACEKEHRDQGFDQLPTSRYGIRVRMVQEPPGREAESEEMVAIPDDLQFKEFKPYTSLGTVAPRAAPQTRNHVPEQKVMNKRDVVKSITGFHQITTLTVGQLGRNVAHAVVPQHIRTNDSIDRKERMALEAGNATIETIRRVVRVSNTLLRIGQKAMALYIDRIEPEDRLRLLDVIINKRKHGTAEEALQEAAEKRKERAIKNNSRGGTSGNISASNNTRDSSNREEETGELQDETQEQPVDPEEESDETGTQGDYGGFFASVLAYLRSPTSTIKYNNRNRGLINAIRNGYLQAAGPIEEDLLILGRGLESSIVKTLGVMLAVQIRRYFIDKAAGLTTSLPESPVHEGFMFLSETDLWQHLFSSRCIREYLHYSTGEDPEMIDLSEKPPGWLLTRLVTPVGDSLQSPARLPTGHVYNNFARTTTIATVDELNDLREAIRSQAFADTSSSQYLMDKRPHEQCIIHDPQPGQPRNVLPSFLLRGMIVTDGRSLHLSAVNLRIRSRRRFMTELVTNPTDGHIYRHHVLAPDPYRLLPAISTAIPDENARSSFFFPDISKVDIGALDLGKEYMAAFSCTRYDRPEFIYSVQAKTKAVYQPTVKAAKELEARLDKTTIRHNSEGRDQVEAITVYQSGLISLNTDPLQRIEQEKKDEFLQLSSFYNKHGEHQKRQAHSKRGRRG